MKASEVNANPETYIKDGRLTERFAVLLRTVNALLKRTGGQAFRAFGPLPSANVADLPDPALYPKCALYVNDGASNQHLATSDGSDWRWGDGTIVS